MGDGRGCLFVPLLRILAGILVGLGALLEITQIDRNLRLQAHPLLSAESEKSKKEGMSVWFSIIETDWDLFENVLLVLCLLL